MKTLFSALVLLLSVSASAQYYYKDIMGTKESTDLIALYKQNNVQSVSMKSYTIDNIPIDGISVSQQFFPALAKLLTITKTDYSPASYLTTYFDAEGKILKTADSSGNLVNTTEYTYTSNGKLASIITRFGDPLTSLQTDEHKWLYDAQNKVSKMWRIKNGKDSSSVTFKLDDNGNVIEEQETRRFIKEEPFYYYYDAKNRLTDIVRFNKKASRLLPEQMFEYSVVNHNIQRTTIPQNSTDYFIWKYRFNDKGLKTREEIYNKQKELTGKVEYTYTYAN